jgi:hypothetical protein
VFRSLKWRHSLVLQQQQPHKGTNKMIQEIIQFVLTNQVELIAIVTSIMVAAEKIAKMTKTTKDDEIVGKVRKVVNRLANVLAANFISPTK